jgi:glucokinase
MPRRRVIGFDAGGTKLLGGVVDDDLVVHHRVRRALTGAGQAELLDVIGEAVAEARAAAPDVEAIGFGIPALVDWPSGYSRFSVHLPLDELPFRELLSERLDFPVLVDNDANCAMLAEHRAGAAAEAPFAVMLTLGTGIGSGLVLGGQLYRGPGGAAPEMGHMVIDFDGPPHAGDCPGRGCLEAFCSGTAIGRDGAAEAERRPESGLGRALAAGREITGALVTELAHDGDETACDVIARVGRRLGAGITGIVNALSPQVVVVGGGAIAAGDLLLAPAREVVAERALPPMSKAVRILPAHFGEEAGMLGAALLALDRGGVRA